MCHEKALPRSILRFGVWFRRIDLDLQGIYHEVRCRILVPPPTLWERHAFGGLLCVKDDPDYHSFDGGAVSRDTDAPYC